MSRGPTELQSTAEPLRAGQAGVHILPITANREPRLQATIGVLFRAGALPRAGAITSQEVLPKGRLPIIPVGQPSKGAVLHITVPVAVAVPIHVRAAPAEAAVRIAGQVLRAEAAATEAALRAAAVVPTAGAAVLPAGAAVPTAGAALPAVAVVL